MKVAALELASLGHAIFPVASDGRTPIVERGVYAASCDAEQVAEWWSRWPKANIGLACGPVSGVLALDIDRKGGKDGFRDLAELESEFGELPATVQSRTPSGGRHLLFAHPPGLRIPNRVGMKRYDTDGSRRVYNGLDTRSEGGFICVPPSRKGGQDYRWIASPMIAAKAAAPAWLLGLMMSEPPPRRAAPREATFSALRVVGYVAAAINGECSELAAMEPETGRNQRLFLAAARLGELVAGGCVADELVESALERAAETCGLVADTGLIAVRRTIASGFRHGAQHPRSP